MAIAESDWMQLNNVSASRPVTTAAAATIVPTTFLTVLTGNTAITAITPPLLNQTHMIAIQFAGTAGITAGNNILTTKASVVGEVMLLVYNPNTAKYIPVG